MQIEEITSAAAFEALAPAWAALWARDPRATPFQHPAWLLPWWTQCGGGQLAVYAGWEKQRLVAFLPMSAHRGRLFPVGIGISDYHDVLLEPGSSAAPLLARLRRPAELHELRPDSPLGGETPMSACAVLTLPPAIPKRKRYDLRRARRDCVAAGAAVEAATQATLAEHLAALVGLHAARWAARGQTGVLADATVRRFHAASLPRLFAAGLARLYGLRHDGRLVASWYVLHAHRRAYGYLTGRDPAAAALQPGTAVLGHAIDEAVAEGCLEFDLLRGIEPYKRHWGAVERPNLKRVLA